MRRSQCDGFSPGACGLGHGGCCHRAQCGGRHTCGCPRRHRLDTRQTLRRLTPTNAATPAPVPVAEADPVIASIRAKLADGAGRNGAAAADFAALQSFYAQPGAAPVWITPMGFSAKAQSAIDEIGNADDWGLVGVGLRAAAGGQSAGQYRPAGQRRDQAPACHPALCAVRARRPRQSVEPQQADRPDPAAARSESRSGRRRGVGRTRRLSPLAASEARAVPIVA